MTQSYGPGQIFVLVGPGGAGKNTLMKRVLPLIPNLSQLATATTRPMRPGELEGREHLFVSLDTFMRWKQDGKLLEHQEVHPGKWYGVPRQPLEDAFRAGRDLIADIEIAGAQAIAAAYPLNTVLVFIAAPLDVLEQRMRDRGESEQGVRERMNRAKAEMDFAPQCHEFIMNEDQDTAAQQLHDVILKWRELHKVKA
jgi:guanylate kinase